MRREKGFTLFVALTMLAVMTIIGVALIRAVDTTNEVANNIGFVQSTMISSDNGLEAATTWLQNNSGMLTADSPNDGYYARDVERIAANKLIDYTGSATPGDTSDDVDWEGTGAGAYQARQLTAHDAAGNHVAYLIHRLCDAYGSPGASGVRCARMKLELTPRAIKSGPDINDTPLSEKSTVYYRITTRARGPRNTASYAQSTVVIEY